MFGKKYNHTIVGLGDDFAAASTDAYARIREEYDCEPNQLSRSEQKGPIPYDGGVKVEVRFDLPSALENKVQKEIAKPKRTPSAGGGSPFENN